MLLLASNNDAAVCSDDVGSRSNDALLSRGLILGEIFGARAGEAGMLRFRDEELAGWGCNFGVKRGVIFAGAGFAAGNGCVFTGLVFLEALSDVVPDFDAGLRSGVPRGVLAGVRLLGRRVGVVCISSSNVARLPRLLLTRESMS